VALDARASPQIWSVLASPSLPRLPHSLQQCSGLAAADPAVVPISPPPSDDGDHLAADPVAAAALFSSVPDPEQLRGEEVSTPLSPPRAGTSPLPHHLSRRSPSLACPSRSSSSVKWPEQRCSLERQIRWHTSPREVDPAHNIVVVVHIGGSRLGVGSGLTNGL